MRPIFDRFPGLRERVPFEPVATLPTPVEPVLGLWVKRDDRTHPEVGGGKTRKLEFYLPRFRGPTLAIGTRGSNWLHALSKFAPHTKLFTLPQFMHRDVARFGATHFADPMLFALGVLAEAPRLVGDGEALAPFGGSDPVTCLAYVNAALELAQQIKDRECPRPDAIFVPLGSGGTAAGLALGLGIAGIDCTLYAVAITTRVVANARRLRALACRAAALLELKDVRLPRVDVLHGFCGAGYARPTPGAVGAKRRFAEKGIELDLSYSAKAAAACLAMKVPNALFWLTYGRPR